jgi:hypothetical protein
MITPFELVACYEQVKVARSAIHSMPLKRQTPRIDNESCHTGAFGRAFRDGRELSLFSSVKCVLVLPPALKAEELQGFGVEKEIPNQLGMYASFRET